MSSSTFCFVLTEQRGSNYESMAAADQKRTDILMKTAPVSVLLGGKQVLQTDVRET